MTFEEFDAMRREYNVGIEALRALEAGQDLEIIVGTRFKVRVLLGWPDMVANVLKIRMQWIEDQFHAHGFRLPGEEPPPEDQSVKPLAAEASAQYEIRVYAEAIRELVRPIVPVAIAAWEAAP